MGRSQAIAKSGTHKRRRKRNGLKPDGPKYLRVAHIYPPLAPQCLHWLLFLRLFAPATVVQCFPSTARRVLAEMYIPAKRSHSRDADFFPRCIIAPSRSLHGRLSPASIKKVKNSQDISREDILPTSKREPLSVTNLPVAIHCWKCRPLRPLRFGPKIEDARSPYRKMSSDISTIQLLFVPIAQIWILTTSAVSSKLPICEKCSELKLDLPLFHHGQPPSATCHTHSASFSMMVTFLGHNSIFLSKSRILSVKSRSHSVIDVNSSFSHGIYEIMLQRRLSTSIVQLDMSRRYHSRRKRSSFKLRPFKNERTTVILLHVQDRTRFGRQSCQHYLSSSPRDPVLDIQNHYLNVVRIINFHLAIHCHVDAVLVHVLHFQWLHRTSHHPSPNTTDDLEREIAHGHVAHQLSFPTWYLMMVSAARVITQKANKHDCQ